MIPPDRYEGTFVSLVDHGESVSLYPTIGRWSAQQGAWIADIHAWVHRPSATHAATG